MILDQLFDQHASFTVTVFALAALAFIGVGLLVLRLLDATGRRRSRMSSLVIGQAQSEDDIANLASPTVEVQLRAANHALFMVLMECCKMVTEAGASAPITGSDAFGYATRLADMARRSMSNREIADHGYDFAATLQSLNDPTMAAVRRVLTQLALAERWDMAGARAA